jgi:hypothetical protein
MGYQYNDNIEYDPQADSDHDWVHVGPLENNSPNGPPILNRDNFSSSEAGSPTNDPNVVAQAYALNMNNPHLDEHAPSSYPSSYDGSVPAPDGPEARDPANRFLPVAPATGLGEVQHRRRASFDEMEGQISDSIRRYLKTLPSYEHSFHASWEGVRGGWLPLDPRLVVPTDSVRATRGKSSGTTSALQSSVYSGGSSGRKSSNIDLLKEIGGWAEESAFGDWPMELDEQAIEGDD